MPTAGEMASSQNQRTFTIGISHVVLMKGFFFFSRDSIKLLLQKVPDSKFEILVEIVLNYITDSWFQL